VSDDRGRRRWYADYVSHPRHGPLPALLLVLTVFTGLVDAVSILSLGRVFVANMTGNVVFIGFALGGAPGFSLQASLIALVGFLAGAAVGGTLVARHRGHRGVLLRNAVAVELVLLVAQSQDDRTGDQPYGAVPVDVVVACAAVALGLQNAVVRALAVPDLTTTVLTMTLTGIAADVRTKDWRTALRRLAAVVAMLGGALVGTLLVLGPGPATALAVACGLVAVVLVGATRAARGTAGWHAP
jgi:uncharacterized membrane protein YoaK (UPF0700 family)